MGGSIGEQIIFIYLAVTIFAISRDQLVKKNMTRVKYLGSFFMVFILGGILGVVELIASSELVLQNWISGLKFYAIYYFFLWALLRRLRDCDTNTKLLLFLFVPGAIIFFMLYGLLMPGNQRESVRT